MYTSSFFDTIKGQEFVDAVISLTKKIDKIDSKKYENCNKIDSKKCENCNNIDALTREKIFRDVERQYRIEDAKIHCVEHFQQDNGNEELNDDAIINMVEEDFGNDIWDKIVARFEKNKDCNIAENVTWEDAVKYFLCFDYYLTKE